MPKEKFPTPEESPAPQEARVKRKIEREQFVAAVEKEGFVKRHSRRLGESVAASITPETYLGKSDVELFKEAGCDSEQFQWIADVKRASREEMTSSVRFSKSIGDKEAKWVATLNAYDLVYVHALLARDFKKLGPYDISKETENLLDDILLKIASKYTEVSAYYESAPRSDFSSYDLESKGLFRKYQELSQQSMAAEEAGESNSKIALQKAGLLQRWLTVIHNGGNQEVLDMFQGYPTQINGSFRERQKDKRTFLSKLNNLGYKS